MLLKYGPDSATDSNPAQSARQCSLLRLSIQPSTVLVGILRCRFYRDRPKIGSMSSQSSARRPSLFRIGPRFSLRVLLAGMLVAAICFSWFGWRLRKSQRQLHARAVLESLGAIYAYDYQGPIVKSTTYPWNRAPTPGTCPYPRRLHQWLGQDFLHNVTRVHLETPSRLSDENIDRLWQALGNLPDLTHLEASGPVTRPGSIQRLRHSRRLESLALRWAHIADEDLAILAKMPRLKALNLNETPVTDAAMPHVVRAKALEAIELHHTKISDQGLRNFATLPHLRRLRLSGTTIGDAGVKHLRGLNQLHDLDLVHTLLTDDALVDVASLSSLERLDLSMTAVTDQGLRHLQRLPHLRELRLEAMTKRSDLLVAIPKLPALEELHCPLLTGDLSRLAECPKLRILHTGFASQYAVKQGLKLPPTLEEIRGLALTDETIDELASLPNLKVIHDGRMSSYDPAEIAEIQRLRAKLQKVQPNVQLF
jgi:hypothetical protein